MKLSGSVPCLSFNPLGSYHDNKYYIDDECLSKYNYFDISLVCFFSAYEFPCPLYPISHKS